MSDRSTEPPLLEAVAARAVRASGDYLLEAFRDDAIEAEYGTDDVKSAADRVAEDHALAVIRDAYPDHAVHGEESGRAGDHRYEWVVDPLDGTNNFAADVPLFASAACVLDDGDPLVSAVYEPLPDSLYLARRGGGATADGEELRAESDRSLPSGTVSFVVGLPALRNQAYRDTADRLEDTLDDRCKRVVNTWSPCVDWALLARGSIEGLVAYRPDVYEQYAGALLAEESGVVSRIFDVDETPSGSGLVERKSDDAGVGIDGLYVAAPDRETCDRLVDAATAVLD
ncbi:inositol monophosphatase family protein [Halobellus rufus]|uniref:inositol monophosphatase family protein n=1 Tax=Halobellus rufus TaxID=1448860 RepID=UPI0009DF2665|nr:inositol monophosphatase [Halobellus rufus]